MQKYTKSLRLMVSTTMKKGYMERKASPNVHKMDKLSSPTVTDCPHPYLARGLLLEKMKAEAKAEAIKTKSLTI